MLDLYGTLDKEKFGIKIIAKSQITTDDLKQQSFRLQVVVLKILIHSFSVDFCLNVNKVIITPMFFIAVFITGQSIPISDWKKDESIWWVVAGLQWDATGIIAQNTQCNSLKNARFTPWWSLTQREDLLMLKITRN